MTSQAVQKKLMWEADAEGWEKLPKTKKRQCELLVTQLIRAIVESEETTLTDDERSQPNE